MPDRRRVDAAEKRITGFLMRLFTRWLAEVLETVLAGWRLFGLSPQATAVYATVPVWADGVDQLLDQEIEPLMRAAWEEATDFPYVSGDAFVMAHLATVRNLLVRMPDEVYNLIFSEIIDGANDGEGPREIAERITRVLDVTGSERWPSRAMTIAITEANRANNAGAYASALADQRVTGDVLAKRWLATEDRHTRGSHRRADGQLRGLTQPFQVGLGLLQYPGDPLGPPEEVINCRCALVVEEQ